MGDVLTIDDMADAVLATQRNLNVGKWIGEMVDLQDFVLFKDFTKKRAETTGSGRGFTQRYVMDHNHSAQRTGLYDTVEFTRDDAVAVGEVPWRMIDANMVYDEREPDMNAGAERLFDHVDMEQQRAMTSAIVLVEDDLASKPATSADDDQIWGLEYWVTRNATTGFTGGNPTGFAAGRAGISSVTYERHRNYAGTFTTYDDQVQTGLVWMLERASAYTNWKSPTPEPGMGRKGYGRVIYCNWETKMELKNIAKANNDSLGFDLATQEPQFRGNPIVVVPKFNADTTNPVYMLDLDHIYCKFLRDWNMKAINLGRLQHQPHCFGSLISLVFNLVCDDLRRQTVFYLS